MEKYVLFFHRSRSWNSEIAEPLQMTKNHAILNLFPMTYTTSSNDFVNPEPPDGQNVIIIVDLLTLRYNRLIAIQLEVVHQWMPREISDETMPEFDNQKMESGSDGCYVFGFCRATFTGEDLNLLSFVLNAWRQSSYHKSIHKHTNYFMPILYTNFDKVIHSIRSSF